MSHAEYSRVVSFAVSYQITDTCMGRQMRQNHSACIYVAIEVCNNAITLQEKKTKRDEGMACQKVHKQGRIKVTLAN